MENYQKTKMIKPGLTKFIKTVFLLSSLFLTTMCASRKSLPLKGPLDVSNNKVTAGQVVFMEYCYKCHPSGEAGLGPALNSNPAPGFLKRFQVRHGLGVMPSFKRNEISRDDMDKLIAYMKALRHNK
ncbi:MAG TPA: cytochrome c [Cytophagales bacterium]|nr:cytochrome c [Cytophagales bacterium]